MILRKTLQSRNTTAAVGGHTPTTDTLGETFTYNAKLNF